MKVVLVIILVAVAGYLGYRILSQSKPGSAPVVESEAATPATSATPTAVQSKLAPATNATAAAKTNKPMAVTRIQETTAPKSTGEWKAKMEVILGSNANAQQKVQDLKALLSTLEEAEAEQAVQELTRRVNNEGYAFLKPLAIDPKLPEAVRDEFMVDMLNRPNAIKLPLFLEIARNPDHPDRESAFDNLEIFTGLKYGADWDGWDKGIQQWLKENPERPRGGPAPPPAGAIQ